MEYSNFTFSRHTDARTDYLKISLDCEQELVDENTFESCDVVLLVEHKHSLFIVN